MRVLSDDRGGDPRAAHYRTTNRAAEAAHEGDKVTDELLYRIIDLLERADARDAAAFARMTEVLDAQAPAPPTEGHSEAPESRSARGEVRQVARKEWPDRCSCVRLLVAPLPVDRFASCDPPGYSIAKGCKYCGGTGAPVRAPWNALPDAIPAPRNEDLPQPPPGTTLDILFDGPPENGRYGRFVEVERDGVSVRAGQWIEGPGEFWTLRIMVADLPARSDAEKSLGEQLREIVAAFPAGTISEATVTAQVDCATVTATVKPDPALSALHAANSAPPPPSE